MVLEWTAINKNVSVIVGVRKLTEICPICLISWRWGEGEHRMRKALYVQARLIRGAVLNGTEKTALSRFKQYTWSAYCHLEFRSVRLN